MNKYHLSENHFVVIPGAGDHRLFYYSEDERKQLRQKFQVAEKHVLIYSGKLAMKWEIPDDIFLFYKKLLQYNPDMVLFLLTPDMKIAEELSLKHGFRKDQIIIKSAKYTEVRPYLNMADAALLLREDIPMNHVASPTKFAEYLLCGLPVIMSDAIKDFAAWVKKYDLGVVLNHTEPEPEIADFIMGQTLDNRRHIAGWAEKHLSKESYLPKIIDTLKTV